MILFGSLRLLAVVFSFYLFMRGFFPLKELSTDSSIKKVSETIGTACCNERVEELISYGIQQNYESEVNKSSYIEPHSSHKRHTCTEKSKGVGKIIFKKLIFMVIDAFRADFFQGPFNYMPKTHKILKLKKGLHLTAQSHPPTITLPRIKAITTGSVPSFSDVVLNFGSSALTEDNIVTQMKTDGKSILFFGDDTWLSLFPGHFSRHDGTTSFFVTDYTEVDRNVSRHLPSELQRNDWDVMILHYLGLDHIGHLAGPASSLIKPKLLEMDDVIQQIFSSMENWRDPSLLVVCGDHGMSDQGGHGGASVGEVSVPVIFLSPQMQLKKAETKPVGLISQLDLCPTLSVLLDLPIPRNSLGRVIPHVLFGWPIDQQVAAVMYSTEQSMQILKSFVSDISKESSYMMHQRAINLYLSWKEDENSTNAKAWEEEGKHLLSLFAESHKLMAEKVGKLATQYDVYAMATAMCMLSMLFLTLVLSLVKTSVQTLPSSWSDQGRLVIAVLGSQLLTHITVCTGGVPSAQMCGASMPSIAFQLGSSLIILSCALYLISYWPSFGTCILAIKQCWTGTWVVERFLYLGTFCHSFTLLSSSFVEEEHQTFYFFTISIHLLLLFQLTYVFLTSINMKESHKDMKKVQLMYPSGNEVKTQKKSVKEIQGAESNVHYEEDHTSHDFYGETTFGVDSTEESLDRPVNIKGTSTYENSPVVNRDQYVYSTSAIDRKRIDVDNDTLLIKCVCIGEKCYQSKDRGEGWMELNLTKKEFLHLNVSLVCVLLMLRVLRRWNQTGNKWLDMPDFGDWLVMSAHKHYLTLLVVFSMMVLVASRRPHLHPVQSLCLSLSLATTYFSRVAAGTLFFPVTKWLSHNGILEARASFFLIGIMILVSISPSQFFSLEDPEEMKKAKERKEKKEREVKSKKSQKVKGLGKEKNSPPQPSLHEQPTQSSSNTNNLKSDFMTTINNATSLDVGTCSHPGLNIDDSESNFPPCLRLAGLQTAWLCLSCLLVRPHNIPLMVCMSLIEQMMTTLLLQCHFKPHTALLYCIWMGQTFFFLQGNSNSLSTVDVSAGYIGLTDYTPALIGLLMAVSTYAGPVFWLITFLKFIFLLQQKSWNRFSMSSVFEHLGTCLVLTRALPLSVYTVLVSAQRYHLFVWTVFSPKLLYEGMNTVITGTFAAIFYFLALFPIDKLSSR